MVLREFLQKGLDGRSIRSLRETKSAIIFFSDTCTEILCFWPDYDGSECERILLEKKAGPKIEKFAHSLASTSTSIPGSTFNRKSHGSDELVGNPGEYICNCNFFSKYAPQSLHLASYLVNGVYFELYKLVREWMSSLTISPSCLSPPSHAGTFASAEIVPFPFLQLKVPPFTKALSSLAHSTTALNGKE